MTLTDRLLTPGEVALMFRVDPKTVTRWANAGLISYIRTPGGHHRFRADDVTAFLADITDHDSPDDRAEPRLSNRQASRP